MESAALRASWSFTISRSLCKLVSIESGMPSNYLNLYPPLLLLLILLLSVTPRTDKQVGPNADL